MQFAVLLLLACVPSCVALDNGLGLTPPRGWRSWDAFLNAATQAKQEAQVDALVDASRLVDGKPTSLLSLGYNRIGLDDSWQACGQGVNGSFHNGTGYPLIKNKTFPDMAAMNAYARARGVGSGWYLNSCDCCERGALMPNWPPQMHGDVQAIVDLGFDGVKLDSCGPSQDLKRWAQLLNATGKAVLIENCFDNASFPFVPSGVDDGHESISDEACPMNLFRSGGDMRADWPLMLRRLQTIAPWLRLSRPGCWAYLDMLEVGHPPGGTGEGASFQNVHSWRAHFGAWAVTSSPLILSFDLSNSTLLDLAWPFIANPEVLKVNSDWQGEAGRLVSSTYDTSAPTPVYARPCTSSLATQSFVLASDGKIHSAAPGDDRCLALPGCPQTPPRESTQGGLILASCNGSPSQQWIVGKDPHSVTNVQSVADKGCWEVNGCSGTAIDTNYGCKALPATVPCAAGHTCDCNMAFRFLRNGSIVSAIPSTAGGALDQCLRLSEKDESSISLGPCTGSARETFSYINGTIRGAGGGCVDNHGTKPLHPQYGPLVLTDCNQSQCGGDDHRWQLQSNGQLQSAVMGVGEPLCAEVESYQNHNAVIRSVGCADADAVPRAQHWHIDASKQRVSVDVRFDASQQRSPGMLLCVDIDLGARPNGQIMPGSKLLTQVFSKKVANGGLAVLFLNADVDGADAADITVNLTALGMHGAALRVRDLWGRTDLGQLVAGPMGLIYTAKGVPPQDSAFVLFAPEPQPRLTVSPLAVLLSQDALRSFGVDWPDAGLYAIRHGGGERTYFMEGGSNEVHDMPGTPWTVLSSAGRADLTVQDALARDVAVQDYPCPTGFESPCVRLPPSEAGLNVQRCDGSPSQRWRLLGSFPSVIAVQNAATEGCWELNGCRGADVDTSFGCKRVPPAVPCPKGHDCDCNMAWRIVALPRGVVQIISGINGPSGKLDRCLQVTSEKQVKVGACTGDAAEHFLLQGNASSGYTIHAVSAERQCVDNRPSHAAKASTVGQWVSNVYDATQGGNGSEVLAFIHLELRVHGAPLCYFQQGLAFSTDGGRSFKWCGLFAQPNLSYEHSEHSDKYGRPRWFANMGLSAYVIKDGYFYSYFTDTNDLNATGGVVNVTGIPASAGNPDQGVAVVRARVDEVLDAARRFAVTPWHKWHGGKWEEPALGGAFTPLDMPVQGYMHGDAAFCEPLNEFVMVTFSGGRIIQKEAWRKSILIAFSSDGISWSGWQTVWTDTGHHSEVLYPSIMSYGPDNEVVGETFAVVFQYRNVSAPFQFAFVNVTVRR